MAQSWALLGCIQGLVTGYIQAHHSAVRVADGAPSGGLYVGHGEVAVRAVVVAVVYPVLDRPQAQDGPHVGPAQGQSVQDSRVRYEFWPLHLDTPLALKALSW